MTGREAGNRAPHVAYWVLRGPREAGFVCARFGRDEEYAALCVFDSRKTAEEYLRCLSEPQMFLDTLEHYGLPAPSWVLRETLLPEACELSNSELWETIEDVGVGYVAMNPPPWRVEKEAFELHPSRAFKAR